MTTAARAALCLCAAMLCVPGAAAAQQREPLVPAGVEVIDRVVAVVGERVILLSEIEEILGQMRAQGVQVPEDSARLHALRRETLDQLIDDEVLYQRARRDTAITVTDAEVTQAVEQSYQQVRRQFRTEAEFRAALAGAGYGTPDEYRRFLTDQQRRSAFIQRFIQRQQQDGKLRGGTVSEAELRRAYQQVLAQPEHDRRAPSITLQQIVVAAQPTDSARTAARAEAESVRVAIEGGADFATMARRFSDDVGTRENGGDLGFFRRGMMVRPFEEVAFRLRPNVVSPVVSTPFGYHLIWVDRIQTAEVKARHILFAPGIRPQDLAAARQRAESLAALVRRGANADSLARIYGDTSEPRSIGPADRRNLPGVYAQALAQAQTGDVVGPFPSDPDAPTRTRFIVVKVTDVSPEREYTFDEVREQLRGSLTRQQGIRNLVADLRRRTFVDVRM